MRQTDANRTGPHVAAQVASSWASLDAANRSSDLADALSSQDRAFMAAMREMQVVRDFVGTPENILGSAMTKHGEIAEQVNVAIIRARDILLGHAPTATFEGVGRFAPTDYRVDGVDIQSKYHNGLRNTLDGVLGQAAAIGAAVGGGVGLAQGVWVKCREGKSPFRRAWGRPRRSAQPSEAVSAWGDFSARAIAFRVGSHIINRHSGEGRSPEGKLGGSAKAGSE